MKFSIVYTAVALLPTALAQGITLFTPANVVQCTPVQISWTGGVGPFTLLIQTPDANGQIVETIPNIAGSPYTWNANVLGPTQLGLSIRDSTGAPGQSGAFPVNGSPDSSCLTTSSGASGPTSSGPTSSGPETSPSVTSSGPSSTPSTPATTSSSPSSTPSGPSSTPSTSSHPSSSPSSGTHSTSGSPTSSSPATSSTGAALSNTATAGFAGFLGLVLGGLLA